ncbi:envelope glycoprotein E [Testudinid alphaherpesvirus 3]|uniref:Envelope glycoprotein E n=1 Tax=Testudinid alphaherpesvirus 3 TaxID=2560801 RepID=A0A0K1R1R8_9ALPH|nr:envelope glycoprotein E [Testudinid alphaherpesvirus 3]AIU39308.1 envelope glycoprotein E [Testudinid alphaherpesvirus 3]AIU39418.1 envelope glycoprotein E [Testudinid alphaherpesvirus 3]AKI81694.1 envelope glycoprotein E [Testudinid alphaherpesvirus 3]AKI81797.1 envelope glycoprotein E [Testudinid alphaherpesvirus 3]AKV40661.1 glycoprotein E [Testudinid alphaherpesvirus 3]
MASIWYIVLLGLIGLTSAHIDLSLPSLTFVVNSGDDLQIPVRIRAVNDSEDILRVEVFHLSTPSCGGVREREICDYEKKCHVDLVFPADCQYAQAVQQLVYRVTYVNCSAIAFQKGWCSNTHARIGTAHIAHGMHGFGLQLHHLAARDSGIYKIIITGTHEAKTVDFSITVLSSHTFTDAPRSSSPFRESTVGVMASNTLIMYPGSTLVTTAEIVDTIYDPEFNLTIGWYHFTIPSTCQSIVLYPTCLELNGQSECETAEHLSECSITSLSSSTVVVYRIYNRCTHATSWRTDCMHVDFNDPKLGNRISMQDDGNIAIHPAGDEDSGLYLVVVMYNGRFAPGSLGYVSVSSKTDIRPVLLKSGIPSHTIIQPQPYDHLLLILLMAMAVILTVIILLTMSYASYAIIAWLYNLSGAGYTRVALQDPYRDEEPELEPMEESEFINPSTSGFQFPEMMQALGGRRKPR